MPPPVSQVAALEWTVRVPASQYQQAVLGCATARPEPLVRGLVVREGLSSGRLHFGDLHQFLRSDHATVLAVVMRLRARAWRCFLPLQNGGFPEPPTARLSSCL